MLLAQMTDPGWFSLVIQVGAFGLLTYMVVVMYPKQQKDLRDEREKRDKLFLAMITDLQARFTERNALVVDAMKEETRLSREMLDNLTRKGH